jgi:hypothetical protein
MQRPAMAFALAGSLAIVAVAVPYVEQYHQSQLIAQHEKDVREQHVREQQQIAAAAQEKQAVYAINDDELLTHVDSDIAQGTPDAMQPLASLMSDDQDDRVKR